MNQTIFLGIWHLFINADTFLYFFYVTLHSPHKLEPKVKNPKLEIMTYKKILCTWQDTIDLIIQNVNSAIIQRLILLFYSSEPYVTVSVIDQAFVQEYNENVDFISRSPGRVNLIGDHIDYNFFPVLPMAIEVDVICGVKTDIENRIILSNTNSQFQQEVIELPKDGSVVEINKDVFSWGNYFKCGLIVAHKYILEKHPERKLRGMKMSLMEPFQPEEDYHHLQRFV